MDQVQRRACVGSSTIRGEEGRKGVITWMSIVFGVKGPTTTTPITSFAKDQAVDRYLDTLYPISWPTLPPSRL